MTDRAPKIYVNLIGATAVSIAVFGALAVFEFVMFDRKVLAEGAPGADLGLGLHFLGRSLLALLLSLLVIGGLYTDRDIGRDFPSGGIGLRERIAGWAFLAVTVALVLMFLADPVLFSSLGREDRSIEWASALALFAASGLLFHAFLRLWAVPPRPHGFYDKLGALSALLLSAGIFVIGMEEISWMQRVFAIETPERLREINNQQELNFHNIFTGTFEIAYYLGAFSFLILLPFSVDLASPTELPGKMSLLVPSRSVVVASAPMTAFNYDMWDILPIQMSMMMTVLVLLFYMARALGRRETAEARLFATAAAVLVASQLVFLAFGDRLVRIWDPTEYKELFIATGLACFAFEVARRLRGEAAAEALLPARPHARPFEHEPTRPGFGRVIPIAGADKSAPAKWLNPSPSAPHADRVPEAVPARLRSARSSGGRRPAGSSGTW